MITPYVVGSKVSINPLVAVFSLLLFGKLWGLSGLVLALHRFNIFINTSSAAVSACLSPLVDSVASSSSMYLTSLFSSYSRMRPGCT